MNVGEMRLHWDGRDGIHYFEDFHCLHDALEKATDLIAGAEGKPTALTNWMDESAIGSRDPVAQLAEVAAIRMKGRQLDTEGETMVTSGIWGAFG